MEKQRCYNFPCAPGHAAGLRGIITFDTAHGGYTFFLHHLVSYSLDDKPEVTRLTLHFPTHLVRLSKAKLAGGAAKDDSWLEDLLKNGGAWSDRSLTSPDATAEKQLSDIVIRRQPDYQENA